MNKRISGVVLSYCLIVIDIAVAILFVPFLLKKLGADEYGLYKLMQSTASYLSVLDFGIGGTITRYVVKYRTEGNRRKEENFVAMGLIIYGMLSLILIIAGLALSFAVPVIYRASIQPAAMRRAQVVLFLLCATTAISLFNHAYNGLISAYERFSFSRISNIVKILLRVLLIVWGTRYNSSAYIIVSVDLSLAVQLLVCNIFYVRFSIKERVHLYKWDHAVAKEAGVFTLAILMQSIINQFNSNVDNVVLGIYTTTASITLYSLALQIYNMYGNLSTAISTVYLPSISAGVFKGETGAQITARIIAPSRIQLMVLLLALTGFYLFGQSFIHAWVGPGYEYAYVLTCVLLTSSTLELSQNTITSVLKAKNKLHGKTMVLAAFTALNAAITFLLVPKLGAIGAVIGTAFSMVVGYGIALNIYYYKVIHIDLGMYFRETYRGIWAAAILSVLCGLGIKAVFPVDQLMHLKYSEWITFVAMALIYTVCYAMIMLLVGMNETERKHIKRFLPFL